MVFFKTERGARRFRFIFITSSLLVFFSRPIYDIIVHPVYDLIIGADNIRQQRAMKLIPPAETTLETKAK